MYVYDFFFGYAKVTDNFNCIYYIIQESYLETKNYIIIWTFKQVNVITVRLFAAN